MEELVLNLGPGMVLGFLILDASLGMVLGYFFAFHTSFNINACNKT